MSNEYMEEVFEGLTRMFVEREPSTKCFVVHGLTNYDTAEEAYGFFKRFGRIIQIIKDTQGVFYVQYEQVVVLGGVKFDKSVNFTKYHNLPEINNVESQWSWQDITPSCKVPFSYKSTIFTMVKKSLKMSKVINRESSINSAAKHAQNILGVKVTAFGPYTWKLVDQEGDILYFYTPKLGQAEVNKMKNSTIFSVEGWDKGVLTAIYIYKGIKCIFIKENEVDSSEAIREYCERYEIVRWELTAVRKWWALNYPPASLGPGFFVLEWMMLQFLMESKQIPGLGQLVEGKIKPVTQPPPKVNLVRVFVGFLCFFVENGFKKSFDLRNASSKDVNNSKMTLYNFLSSSQNLMARVSREEQFLLLHKFNSTIIHLIQ